MEEEQWYDEHESCHECKNRDDQHNMTTCIYNGITNQALRDQYDKLGRKDRTVENMVSMTVSGELSRENTMAYANTSNTAIHAIKSFHKKPSPISNKDPNINAINMTGPLM